MKLTSATLLAFLLVLLAGLCPRAAEAEGVVIHVPDPSCASLGTITVPVITLGGAPGDCTDFTYEGSTSDNLAIVVTDPVGPLTCSIVAETGQAFNQCDVVLQDLTVSLTPAEIALLDAAIALIPGLTSAQITALDAAVLDLSDGDGLIFASCNTELSVSCSDMTTGETGGVSSVPEPATLPLLAIGLSLLAFGGWKHRKLIASSHADSASGLPA